MLDSITDLEVMEKTIASMSEQDILSLAEMPDIKARLGATAVLTERQKEAEEILRGPAKHVMLFGGSRSGKTFLIIKEMIERALVCKSRHAILRFTLTELNRAIINDTFPKVMQLCFPGIADQCTINKQLFFVKFPNGSEIWFGGLADSKQADKILGQEYSTIYLNECSQISMGTRETVISRLAEKTVLRNKMFYDCNPSSKRHWSYMYFIEKVHPARNQPLKTPENYDSLQMNPEDNLGNIDEEYISELQEFSAQKRRRFYEGVFADEGDNALFSPNLLDKGRVLNDDIPDMQRVVIAIDPSGCSGPEDHRSDEVGIVVAGLGTDGRCYVLEDLSGRFGPEKWKSIAAMAYVRWEADCVVAETNYGGAMVKEVMRTASDDNGYMIPFREVKATRSKIVRAEPISTLFEQGRASLVGYFKELEQQLCFMTTAGYLGDRSPDRADAMIWALTTLYPAASREIRAEKAPKYNPKPVVKLGYGSSKRYGSGRGRSY